MSVDLNVHRVTAITVQRKGFGPHKGNSTVSFHTAQITMTCDDGSKVSMTAMCMDGPVEIAGDVATPMPESAAA